MNSIHGIIHDLADEKTVIGGCTTAGEVIITMQNLVEQNNSLKEKLEQISQIIKEWKESTEWDVEMHDTLEEISKVLEQE